MPSCRYAITAMADATTAHRIRRVRAIAAFTLIEARRTRLLWAAVLLAAILVASSVFARSLALTESGRLQIAFLAPAIRACAVFVTCLHVLSSMLREAQDKVTDLLLSVDLERGEYLLGKLLGYMAVSTMFSVVLASPLLAWTAPGQGLAWISSLVLECWMVSAAAVFCAVTWSHVIVGTAFVLGLYLLSRSMAAIVLIATASPFRTDDWSATLLAEALRALSWLLPDLSMATRTAWLVGQAPTASELGVVAIQIVVALGVFAAAGLTDLYRRNT